MDTKQKINTSQKISYFQPQLRDDTRDLEAIGDGYRSKISSEYWLAYALQKDSIQNSWDAKISKKNWKITIKLLQTEKGRFVEISDMGTVGLTGRLFGTRQELAEILKSKDPGDHLAHFISSNFSTKNSDSGGRRGRGKSLFLISSTSSRFYFDSIRSTDKAYVSGSIFIGENQGVEVILKENDKSYLADEIGKEFSQMAEPGTRIFIKDPKPEVVEAFLNGELKNFVEATWWEIIKKFDAKIEIGTENRLDNAQLLLWYSNEFGVDNEDYERSEYKDFNLSRANKENLRVKRLVLIYSSKEEIPDGIKGIAIQRRGMTIERRATEQLVKEEGMSKVYGWLEMDESLEESMYDLEDVEHLSFMWVKNPAKDLLDQIKAKTREFAKKINVIETELTKEHKLHKKIEENVAKVINDFLKNLGFSGLGQGKRKRVAAGKVSPNALRISFADFKTPNDKKRIEYDETIQAKDKVINDLDEEIYLTHRTWIVDSNGRTVRMTEKDLTIGGKSSNSQGWKDLKINEKEFPPGDYSLRSKIINLSETGIILPKIGRLEKGLEISNSISFSVAKDPDSNGFIKFEPVESDNKSRYITTRPESNSIIIEYNTKHPYIGALLPISKQEELQKFLLQTGIIVAFNQVMREDLSSENPRLFPDINNENYDASEVLPRVIEEVSKFMWNLG